MKLMVEIGPSLPHEYDLLPAHRRVPGYYAHEIRAQIHVRRVNLCYYTTSWIGDLYDEKGDCEAVVEDCGEDGKEEGGGTRGGKRGVVECGRWG